MGLDVKDATSGFRAYDSYVLKAMDLSQIRTDDYAFQIDMLFHCRNVGCDIAEVPIIFQERKHGKSKLGSLAILEFVKALENSFVARIYSVFDYGIQSSSLWVANTFWIGLKPLRIAIRKTNSFESNESSGLNQHNLSYSKMNTLQKGDF